MQLMCDALSVLGSRHGVLIDPLHRGARIIRFDRFESLPPLSIRAGLIVNGRTIVLPLCAEGQTFAFHDQRLSPCTMSLMGIDPASGIKLKLTFVTPFRPRDPEFSTTPVLGLRLEASRIGGAFRWSGKPSASGEVELFIEFGGDGIAVSESGRDSVDLTFVSHSYLPKDQWGSQSTPLQQLDRLVCLRGQRQGVRFINRASVDQLDQATIKVAWCTHSVPVLQIQGTKYPFRYAGRFVNLSEVSDWASDHGQTIFDNARKVDGIIAQNNCSKSVNNLLAYTLHSWLINTWWVNRNGSEWFSVWEGNCYFHSTVDVEFTQTPFYLAVWPELLGYELNAWPAYSKDGTKTLGDRGAGTLFLSHDMGRYSVADAQCYTHEMEAEETSNYILLSYAYYRRTAEDSIARRHIDTIEKYLAFLEKADTSGDGVPDEGVANTIDDASPAIQYGRAQVYLAVKSAAAFLAGASLLGLAGRQEQAQHYEALGRKVVEVINTRGWVGDHFATLLEKSGKGLIDPWNNKPVSFDEVPGWDAPHIYTANGLAVLDMVGLDVGIDAGKLKTDLRVAAERCLREYGCVHTDFDNTVLRQAEAMQGLAGISRNPGWIAMNLLRDVAAFYRGVDLRYLADRYWEWQTTTNTQEPKLFFETFNGNNLSFYPRGIAVWGFFEALSGTVIDRVAGIDRTEPAFGQIRVPRLFDADWKQGTCRIIES